MLMKFSPGAKFTNILQAAFSYKDFFVERKLVQKAACKMLVKLTQGVAAQLRGLRADGIEENVRTMFSYCGYPYGSTSQKIIPFDFKK
jgi:hypothetical protein